MGRHRTSTERVMFAVVGSLPDVERDLCGRPGQTVKIFGAGFTPRLGAVWLRLLSLCHRTLIARYCAGWPRQWLGTHLPLA